MADLNCPYCDEQIDICHDDGFGYEQDVKHQYECPHCNKKFVFETTVSYYYEADIADCLNDDSHEYRLSRTYPEEFSVMQCSVCGHERELTDDERSKFIYNQ